MIEFSAILAEVETETNAVLMQPGPAWFILIGSSLDDSAIGDGRRSRSSHGKMNDVAAAYGQTSSHHLDEDADPPREIDAGTAPAAELEQLLDDLRGARHSIRDLKSMRRKIAWLCHPDRFSSTSDSCAKGLMAELNARIDAAIEELPNDPVRKNKS